MSIATLILGESGTGKSTSIRNFNPKDVLLIQTVKKPLPFKSDQWKTLSNDTPQGSVYHTDNAAVIVKAMQKTSKPIIIIDDFQYILANEFMRRVLDNETGNQAFQKYNEIARNAWDILMTASNLDSGKRVYILSHTQTDESGKTKIKTIGKLLDEKITIEGLLTIVLRSHVINEQYVFSTKNSGSDTVKSPLGMFDDFHIENDLAAIDKIITDFYGINTGELK
jgi:hypothetical protein